MFSGLCPRVAEDIPKSQHSMMGPFVCNMADYCANLGVYLN